jgi:hypothetical protein
MTTAVERNKHVKEETMEQPATDAVAVTPSNSDDLPCVSRGLYIGAAGTLKVRMLSGVDVTFANVGAGLLPIRCTRVFSTGTSATGIVALW